MPWIDDNLGHTLSVLTQIGNIIAKINTEDLGVIQFLEFSFILISEKNIFLVELWNIMLHVSTFSILLSCQLTFNKTTFSIKAHFLIWSYEACNNNDKLEIENLVLETKCIGPKWCQAEVFPGQSIIWAKVFLRPKCVTGRSMLWAKVVLEPNWVSLYPWTQGPGNV